jgi:hypothetical protein
VQEHLSGLAELGVGDHRTGNSPILLGGVMRDSAETGVLGGS